MGQDWCKNRKPMKFERSPFYYNYKLITDRFYHTKSTRVLRKKNTQIESGIFIRQENYQNTLNNNEYLHTNNMYSGINIRRAIYDNIEIHMSLMDLIIYSGEEITTYAGDNYKSHIALGGKYSLSGSGNNNSKFGLFGQLIYTFHDTLHSNITYELRGLYSIKVSNNVQVTSNFGATYTNNSYKSLIYSLEINWNISKRTNTFTEYIKSAPNRLTFDLFVIGIGYYFHENMYCYISYEEALRKKHNQFDRKLDLGLTYLF